MTDEEASFWDRGQPASAPKHSRVALPFIQRGIAGVMVACLGVPTAGNAFGWIRVDEDAVTVRGFFWRTYVFPRDSSTSIHAARGFLTKGVRLRSVGRANDVVFFPYDGPAALHAALRLAGFQQE